MKKKNLIVLIFNTILCIVLLTTISLAWYTKVTAVPNMSFKILQIDSLVSMYQANDNNYNEAPDLLKSQNQSLNTYYNTELKSWQSYSNQYYQEKYSFNYLDQKYALSSDSSSNLLNTITLDDVAPSKVYTFKFEITNYSGSDNYLTFAFGNATDEIINSISARILTIGYSSSDDYYPTYLSSDWNNINNLSISQLSDKKITIPGSSTILTIDDSDNVTSTNDKGNGRLDVWLQIKVDASFSESLTSYILPEFVLTLST